MKNISVKRSTGIALALGTIYLLWGSTYLGIRFAIETIPPYLMSGIRFLTAGLILYTIFRIREREKPQLKHWRSAAIIGGFLLLGGNATVAWAEQRVPSGIASLVIATMPLWIVLLDWLWQKRDRPDGRVIAGLALGFAGMTVLVSQGSGDGAPGVDLIGVTALLGAAILWATGSLYSRGAPLPKSPLLGIGMQMICGGLLVVCAGLLGGEAGRLDVAAISLTSWIAWGYLAVFGSMIGFSCYLWLMKVAPAEKVATYAYVNPVIAVFLGWAFAGEDITLQTLVASALIIASVVLIINRRKPAPAAKISAMPLREESPKLPGGRRVRSQTARRSVEHI